MALEKRRPGRPPVGNYNQSKYFRFNGDDVARLEHLAGEWNTTEVEVIRKLLEREAPDVKAAEPTTG